MVKKKSALKGFHLRIPKAEYKLMRIAADAEGYSLNAWMNRRLAQAARLTTRGRKHEHKADDVSGD